MKNIKIVFITMLFLLFSFKSYNLFADATEVGSIAEMETAMSNVYSQVEPSDITTGILYGSKVTYTEFFNYQGTDEDSVLTKPRFRQLYKDSFTSDGTGLFK